MILITFFEEADPKISPYAVIMRAFRAHCSQYILHMQYIACKENPNPSVRFWFLSLFFYCNITVLTISKYSQKNTHTKTKMMMKTILSLLMPVMALLIASSDAFVTSTTQPGKQAFRKSSHHNLVMDSVAAFADSSEAVETATSLMLGCASFLQKNDQVKAFLSPFTGLAQNIMTQGEFQAQVVTDVNHVISDFTAFFRPSKSIMKFYSVLGRMLVLMADYLPDRSVHSEELLVQLALVGLGVKDILEDPSFSLAEVFDAGSSSGFSSSTTEGDVDSIMGDFMFETEV